MRKEGHEDMIASHLSNLTKSVPAGSERDEDNTIQ